LTLTSNYARSIFVALLTSLLAACATAPPQVAESLWVPSSQVLTLKTTATGVQIYECRAVKDDPARFEWAFKAPEAQLFDSNGAKIGKHYGGPTWEGNDGSKVVGEVKGRDPGPDPAAIPWLLLTAKSNSGTGIFAKTASVQRLQTVGGVVSAKSCSASQAGQENRVPYQAAYYFYVAQ
jgi:hypothetical protein